MSDLLMPQDDEWDVLAGEYALGVLEGEELLAARQLVLSDRAFAARVQWWDLRLANLAEETVAFSPSEEVWPAIARRLDDIADDGAAQPLIPARSGLSGFSLAAAMAGVAAAAAAITLFFASPQLSQVGPVPTPAPGEKTAPQPRLVAQLQSDDGALSLSGLVEPATDTLSLRIAGLAPQAGSAAELWVVPADGVPRSLGRIPDSGQFSRTISPEERTLLASGSALAVTYEDAASFPHQAPTTDIVLIGGLTEV